MNILLLGPQGSGKGTQARKLCEKYNLFYFEAGGFLRELAKKNESLQKTLSQGNLVPDAEMASYVASYLDEKGLYDGIIFDGFPRTSVQWVVFKSWLKQKNVSLNLVLVLTIGEDETVRRLSARRMDPKTDRIYNLVTDPPPAGVDAATLIQRQDDKPDAIKKRISWYKSEVLPLINELKKDIEVVEIDGQRPIEVIFSNLTKIVDEKWKK